jgi:hypothetical protein
MKQVMMIVPVNAEEYETHQIAQQDRNQWEQRGRAGFMGNSQFKHHDSDEDGNHTIAECFQSAFGHRLLDCELRIFKLRVLISCAPEE